MARLTKTQSKNAYKAIRAKSSKLFAGLVPEKYKMSINDYMAIDKIITKYLKKF